MHLARTIFQAAVRLSTDTSIRVDGRDIPAVTGDSLIATLLRAGELTGCSEFDGGGRAGFCLMGACQDCTLWTASGQRLRACTTEVRPGMELRRSSALQEPGQ
jgi:D-hydroxyproline dehydrogenase subunit gamma